MLALQGGSVTIRPDFIERVRDFPLSVPADYRYYPNIAVAGFKGSPVL